MNLNNTEKWIVERWSAIHQLASHRIAGVKDQLLGMAVHIIHEWTNRPCSDLVAFYRTDGDIDVYLRAYCLEYPETFLLEPTNEPKNIS